MLIFTRKAGQSVRIGDGITVTIKEVRGRQVRLQIEAPREVSIFREEVYQEIALQNEQAAKLDAKLLGELD